MLRFYVSEPQLIDSEGRVRNVRLSTGLDWQNEAVVLIDLETGGDHCMNGTAQIHAELVGEVPAGSYAALRFIIGVPFHLNHDNPLTAEPPLDDSDMHWHWRSGYKFLRAGIRTENDGFWIHTGSAGCEGTVGDITGCRFPNRVEVELAEFVPGESVVQVNLAALVEGTDLTDGEASDCSSGPAEVSCVAPYSALGIDFTSGDKTGPQRVFSLQ